MKTNSQQLLLALTHFESQVRPQPIRLLKQIVAPDLSESGWRSLLSLAQEAGWLKLHQPLSNSQTAYALPAAQEVIKSVFPAFHEEWQTWQGKWTLLIFLQAPKTDRNFRYLRRWCVSEKFMPISRGLYLAPDWWLNKRFAPLAKLYKDAVQLVAVDKWMSGPINSQVQFYYDVIGLKDIYSGISKQTEELLVKTKSQKSLKKQAIEQISALLKQLSATLALDLGVIRYYLPTAITPVSLVERWQSLLSSLE